MMLNVQQLKTFQFPIIAGTVVIALLIASVFASESSLTARKQALGAMQADAQVYDTHREALMALEKELQDLRKRGVGGGERIQTGVLLKRLGEDMIAAGAMNRKVRTGATTTVGAWRSVQITINFRGEFFALQTFLQKLETYPTVVRLERLNLTRESTSERMSLLKVDIVLSVYAFEQPEEAKP